MKHGYFLCLSMVILQIGTLDNLATAQWSNNPDVNTLVYAPPPPLHERYSLDATSDGSGGSIVVWYENRSGAFPADFDIYAQRISANGALLWGTSGVAVNIAAGSQYNPVIASDGRGGAIVVWIDILSVASPIRAYAQRVDSSGKILWRNGGVRVAPPSLGIDNLHVVSDQNGGAVIGWSRYSRYSGSDVFAQHISSTGHLKWRAAGLVIRQASGVQSFISCVADGSAGAIFLWSDRGAVIAQRVDGRGRRLWRNGGIIVPTPLYPQAPAMLSDGTGGAFVAYTSFFGNQNLYLQHVSGGGQASWPDSGTAICRAPNEQIFPSLTEDGSGGVFVTWWDQRHLPPGGGYGYNVYAQHVDHNGTPQWQTDGILVIVDTSFSKKSVGTVSDGMGGMIVVSNIQKTLGSELGDLVAQRVSPSGSLMWGASGELLSRENPYIDIVQTTSDQTGGLIASWERRYSDGSSSIYAQRVDSTGGLGGALRQMALRNQWQSRPTTFSLDQNYSNPFNPTTTISFELKQAAIMTLNVSNTLGQEVAEVIHNELMDEGTQEVEFDASALPSGVYYYKIVAQDIDGYSLLYSKTRKMLLIK